MLCGPHRSGQQQSGGYGDSGQSGSMDTHQGQYQSQYDRQKKTQQPPNAGGGGGGQTGADGAADKHTGKRFLHVQKLIDYVRFNFENATLKWRSDPLTVCNNKRVTVIKIL